MDYSQELQELLTSIGWSIEKLTYASNLLNVHKMLQKNKDLYKIQSTDCLPEQTAITLRKFAQCIGIKNSHSVHQKEQLIQMITTRHAELTHKPNTETSVEIKSSLLKRSNDSNGAYSKEELVELMISFLPGPTKKKRKQLSKCIRREVWNRYIGEEKGTHLCFCCDITIMSQFLFEVGHVISVHDNGDLTIENLRPICSLCNKSMGVQNMVEFIREQKLAGIKNFV